MDSTKIVELFIDDDFEMAGIDAISLVSHPAHEENWLAFKKDEFEQEEEFSPYIIKEDNFCDMNRELDELGEEYHELISEGWEIVRVEKITPQIVEKMNKEKFSKPNDNSELDTDETRVRFKYVGPQDEKNRKFCADMMRKQRVYRIEDIDNLTSSIANEQFGFYSIFLWRGSFNCRHSWVRLIYKKQGKIVNNDNSTQNLLDEEGLGPVLQPDTRTNTTIESAARGTRADGSPSVQWRKGQPRVGFAEVGPRGGIKESKKAPKSDTPNKSPKGVGSAKGDASGKKGAKVSAEQENTLQKKVDDFNERDSNTKHGKATLGALKSVFQRGLGAYNVSHSPKVKSAEQWAYARVNAFLYLLKNGRPQNPKYTGDFDLLPSSHPKAEKMSSAYGFDCPIATQDISVNLKNRQDAIDKAHYGPLNPNLPNEEYWKAKADMFEDTVENAKKSRCGNCAFFVQTKQMLDCISKGINDVNAWDTIDAGELGYCEAFDFKCASKRTCDAWVVGGPITDEKFAESISDYPKGISETAQKVLNWVEKNGWGSCGTDVGKQRANQLAKGEAISFDTVKRMYSYLSRHKKDLESSKSYDEGCGKLMYDAWGGEAALGWSERKISQIEKEKMTFSYDEDKKVLIGAAMVPNRMIIRYDNLGNPYYVFFSKDSIKKMADKFLKEGRTDDTSIEHNGIKLGKDKVFITESWVSDDPIYDKSHQYGFELPAGTWFVAMKVKDDNIWKMIKDKTLNGFSVEGLFAEKSVFSKEDKQINEIIKILKSND